VNYGLRRVRLAHDHSHCVPRDEKFLVGWDGIGEQLAIVCADLALATDRFLIFRWVEAKAGPLHSGTDSRPNIRRVFSDSAGENDCVGASHCSQVGAYIFPRTVGEDFDGKPDPAVVVLFHFRQQLTHVIGEPGNSE
jgi:hypothetical protein